ncbi:hypothetical protein NQ315_001749 [Exocentrus adspersus]|uniref:Uncharacterized protein n=1 Tax=Exocentrus adspersus TaxID=1586481 RepID=A0AAV8WAV7_9CUCU|nr:hypothetical protein NQ315_001749 [Exocentrus adspersus]
MKLLLQLFTTLLLLGTLKGAPTVDSNPTERKGKSLAFLDFLQPGMDYANYAVDNDDYVSMALEENDLSRTIPTTKRIRPQQYNSPHILHQAASTAVYFVNVPVSFVANGKPNSIYQWSGAFQAFPTPAPPPIPLAKPQKPQKKPLVDSTIHRLPGTFTFNGKPEDIFVLRDSYNALYNDVLQNVYP